MPGIATPRSCRAFTLVELVIVVLIIGILAAVVVPRFSGASDAADSALRNDLRMLRTQVMLYQAHHRGVGPGYPGGDTALTPTEGALAAQLTLYSNENGETAASASAEYRFGPYLSAIPINPVNQRADVLIVDDGDAFPIVPDNTSGWIYQPSTGTIAPNCEGGDSDGRDYFNY